MLERDLRERDGSRWDLLTHIAHDRLRHPENYADLEPQSEEVDAETLAQQKAEARRMLRQHNPT